MFNYKEPVVLQGPNPGKSLLIIVGVHGNESCGLKAVDFLLPTLSLESGSVTFVVGNPKAVLQNKRFIEANLNRLFREDQLLSKEERSSREYVQSRKLMELMKTSDALLDIHSSGTKNAIPFAICEPHSFEIAKHLPVEIISSGWDLLEPGGTDYFMNRLNKIGICVECGHHDDQVSVERATKSILIFLQSFGSISHTPHEIGEAKKEMSLVHVSSIYKTKTDFHPAKVFSDFEQVKTGEIIGNDGQDQIRAQGDGKVIFVRERVNPNEEAFIFASDK